MRESLTGAMQHVGTALVASALTTIVGLAMMGFAQFGKFAYSGPTIAICLAVTLLACLTFVPALLATRLGAVIERGSASSGALLATLLGAIRPTAVLRRPQTILALSLIVALPFAWFGWNVNVTYDLLGELSAKRTSRHGTDMLRQYFPPGEIGPLVVLAELPDGNLDSVDGQLTIAELSQATLRNPRCRAGTQLVPADGKSARFCKSVFQRRLDGTGCQRKPPYPSCLRFSVARVGRPGHAIISDSRCPTFFTRSNLHLQRGRNETTSNQERFQFSLE